MRRAGSRTAIISVLLFGILVFGAVFYTWNTATDIFQPVSPAGKGKTVSFEIPKGATTAEIADSLQAKGLIRNALAFRIWARIKGLDTRLQAGIYNKLNSSMAIDQIVDTLLNAQPDAIRVTILDGWRLEQIAQALSDSGLANFKKQDFLNYTQHINQFPDRAKYPLLQEVPQGRSMEGLLFPDSPKTKHLELRPAVRKCLHQYFYLDHPTFGPMHVRVQTWVPFQIKVVLNGRDWLARQLDAAGIGYLKKDNTFTAIDDFEGAQALLEAQLRVNWPMALDGLVSRFHPVHAEWMPASSRVPYYWTVEQSEWATDVVFRSPAGLQAVYPRLVHHAITTFSSRDVLRFLQQKVPASGGLHGSFAGEVVSDLKHRPEGVRIKHASGLNSVKLYDKQGRVLRVETTIHDADDLKVYRPAGDDPAGELKWQPLRKGIADLHRRCELSQAANERYLEALAAVESPVPLGELSGPLCRRLVRDGRRYRALNPLGEADARLLEFVGRGEHLITGFRNRDVRRHLYGERSKDAAVHRRQSGRVSRLLALLRAHGLIQKIPRTHRYQVTERGREPIAAILAARAAGVEKLVGAA